MTAFILISFTCGTASAGEPFFVVTSKDKERFMHGILSLSAYQTAFRDLGKSAAESQENIVSRKTGNGLEVGFRIHSIFGMNFSGDKSADGRQTCLGFGAKVYLPGFFLIGGNVRNLIYGRDRQRFFTYSQVMIENIKNKDDLVNPDYVSTGFRLGLEVRLLTFWSVNAYAGMNSLAGNSLVMHQGLSLTYWF